jgi:hypothetical protein
MNKIKLMCGRDKFKFSGMLGFSSFEPLVSSSVPIMAELSAERHSENVSSCQGWQ